MKGYVFAMLAGVTSIVLTGCASGKRLEVVPSNTSVQADDAVHRLFLVGDGGEENDILRANLDLLRRRLDASDISSTVMYLGDNIYPRGIPSPDDSEAYETAVSVLRAQIEAVEEKADQTILIPGNHDWNHWKAGGHKAMRRQDKWVKDLDKDNVRVIPRKGCPGPEVIELTKDVVVIIMDSQWWLHDWRTEKDIHDDCEIRTRADFIIAFRELLKDYKEQRVIVALHHPLVSAGSHGGYFTLNDHLFPLTNVIKGLYLPLPVIGSIYPVYRSNFGHVQDIANHKYNQLKEGLLGAANLYENVVFVSGHEHSLEYHKYNNHHFVVSGAGSRYTDVGKPKTLQFGHGAPGFVQLNIKEGGAIDLLIWESMNDVTDAPVYRATLTPKVELSREVPDYPKASDLPDSVSTPLSTRYATGGLHQLFFGERYRDVYAIPIKVPVLKLSEEHGGLTPIKKGGGMQTNSLRLKNPENKEYAARSMNKDASKLLPANLQNTFASDIVQDQFAASHPYAAFIIPEMADAAGIYHTNPQLMYMPKQRELGAYNEDFGDQLFLLEERPDDDWSEEPSFGNSEDIISYADVVEKSMDDYRNQVDQEFVARSRLFDFFLGDWDRHDDQWRWASFDRDGGKGKIYRPIPRDRDQAFADYDGFIISIARAFVPIVRKLGVFRDDVQNMKWFNDNGKWFDRDFLNALTEEQWIAAARAVQASLPDEVIERSIRMLPPEVFDKDGPHLIETLRKRRDRLPEMASRYYRVLSKTVAIRGTNNADYFEITRAPGQTRIEIFDSNKEGDKNERYYSRTFTNEITKEIQLYGLEGHDRVVINGKAPGGIRIYFVGGEDEDKVLVESGQNAGNIIIQDTESPSKVVGNAPVTYRQVGDLKNTYERRAFLYNYGVPKIAIAGNPDDGFMIGGGGEWTKFGFQKYPYASMHTLTGFYAIATQAFGIDYTGEWTDVLGKADAGLLASYKAPTFVQNFFGFGNESVEIDSENKDFYRVRKQNITLTPFLRLGMEQGSSLTLMAGYENHEVEMTEGRFINMPDIGIGPDVFENKQFGIVNAAYQYRIVDNPLLTSRGIDFDVSAGLDIPLDGDDDAHNYLKSSLALYYQFKGLGRTVLATRVGMELHGGDYQFYQGALLGSHENFRGVRKERFVGDRMFYHNTDLRIYISQWKSYYLPASFGIQINFDHGRVWLDGEDSDSWHYAYGGGFWFSPFQTLLFSVNYHKSDVDNRISLGMGFLF